MLGIDYPRDETWVRLNARICRISPVSFQIAGRDGEHSETFGDDKQLAVHYIWEDLWWKRKSGQTPWLEKLIRV